MATNLASVGEKPDRGQPIGPTHKTEMGLLRLRPWLVRPAPAWPVACGIAIAIAITTILLRLVADSFVPGVIPYAFVFPAVAAAVIVAGPLSGLITLLICQLLTWYAIVPFANSFEMATPADGAGLMLATLSELILLWALSAYRAAVVDQAISAAVHNETLHLTLRELDHRTKNNLQMIQSVLYLKAQRASGDEAKQELSAAAARIGVVGSMNTNLARSGTDLSHVALKPYLGAVCRQLQESLVPDGVKLTCSITDCEIDTDRALYLGLIVNELVTNALKYAFPSGSGEIQVTLVRHQDDLILVVGDNGCGKAEPQPGARPGLGTKLVQMMVGRIHATIQELPGTGTTYRIEIPAA